MRKNLNLRSNIALGLIFAFLVNTIGPIGTVQAQDYALPAPGVMVHLSPAFNPPILKGIKVHPDNPFRFDFILDKGDSQLSNVQLKEESSKLIKYFLASLTIPEKDLWVNLSPYEKDRIVPESFGRTEMGRDLLAEDYMLKQITASLIYPEGETGKKFWKRIYEETARRFGTTSISVNTFNKVWIIPEKAVVYENAKAGTAYVVESRLKVMLEEDYLAMGKNECRGDACHRPDNGRTQGPPLQNNVNSLGSQIIREIVIPELTKEVNEDKNFSQLRQVYNSLILATWYKKKIKDSILAQVYENKNKVAGVNIDDPQEKQRIYERYLQAFKKGAYNYIKEEIDPVTEQTVPRKYFSGGVLLILPEIIPPTSDQVNRAMTGKDFSVVVEARFDQAIIENLRTISAEQPIRQISFGIGKPNLRTSLTSEELGMVEANPQKYYVINQGAYAGLKQFDSNRERWISYNTSLRTLNNEFDLLDKIKKIHQQDKSKKVIILDWGCGNSVGTIELDKTLTEAEIPHHIYGLSSDLYSQWQGGSQNITFILDDAMNLYRYLSENMVDIIFSHTGLIHVLDRSSFRDFGGDPTKHLNDLVSILRPGGVLIMDIFVLRTARNLEFLSQPDEFKFHGRLFIKKRTAKATYFEFTKDAASEEKDAAMAGTQSLTIQDGLAIVEKLFTDSELQETWRLQMDDNHSGSPLMAPNIEFIAGAWLPHFQQIMQQNGYSPQVFIQEIEQGGLNSDTLNFIKASLKNGGNISSYNVEENGGSINTYVKKEFKKRIRLLAQEGDKQMTICLGGALFGEVKNMIELVDDVLKEVAGELKITNVNDWIDQWQIKIRAMSINSVLLFNIHQRLQADSNIAHKNWVQLEYIDLLDKRQWPRLIQEPADVFLVSHSLYLGTLNNFNFRRGWENINSLKKAFMANAHHFVKQEGLFVTEKPDTLLPPPKPDGFEEIIGSQKEGTGVYIKSTNDDARVAENRMRQDSDVAMNSEFAQVNNNEVLLVQLNHVSTKATAAKFLSRDDRSWFVYDVSDFTDIVKHGLFTSIPEGKLKAVMEGNNLKIIFPKGVDKLTDFLNELKDPKLDVGSFLFISPKDEIDLFTMMLKIAMFSMNKNNSIKAVVAEALKKATIKRKISQGSEVAISIPEPVDPTVRNIIMGRLKRLEHFMLSASFGSGGVRLMATTSMTDEGRIRSVLEANLGDEAMFGKVQLNKTGGIDLTSDKALSVQNNGQGIKFHIDPAQLEELQNAPGFVPVIINIQPMRDIRLWLGLNSVANDNFPKPANDNQSITALKAA